MKAMRLSHSGQPATLMEATVPQPVPGAGEILIRICAAGVTPTELRWYPTAHTRSGDPRTGAIPCHEFSGVVAALGAGVEDLTPGQEVYGMNDWFAEGALAEYCVARPSSVAPKPSSLSHVEAASVPIGALTAWQGLYDRVRLQPGERVLIHGAAGSVGAFAVQLARLRGAHVIATASARNVDFVAALGAGQVIDYQKSSFEESARDLDVVFDTVGGETLRRSWNLLRPHGRMVTIAASEEGADDSRIQEAFFIVEPDRDQLSQVGRLLDGGSLQTFVDATVPLAQASAAFLGGVSNRQGHGKVVVTIAP